MVFRHTPSRSSTEQQEENKNKPSRQEKEKSAQPEKTVHPKEKNAQQQEKNTRPEEKNAHEQRPQEAKSGKQEERGRGNGFGRIPEDRYKANFGRDHRFRVTEANYRDRRFQYSGNSFGFVDAWPSNWLYTQDV